MTTAQITIESEMQRRITLIESAEFRTKCAMIAQEMGITAEEWNKNKIGIIMILANKYCQLENGLA